MDNSDVWKTIITIATGGLAGALMSYAITEHRRRVDFVVQFADKYLERFDDFGEALGILRDRPANPKVDSVRKVGDWFELFATFHQNELFEPGLLAKIGLLDQARRFFDEVDRARSDGWAGGHFQDAWDWWPNLRRLANSTQELSHE